MKKLPDRSCADCGRPAGRKPNGRRRRVCVDCSVQRLVRAAWQMFDGSGDAYDRWLKSAGPNGRPRNDPDKG